MPSSTFDNLPEPKRARIVDAAIAEFARAPYLQATLDNIAKEAKVAKGSLYQYFSGKIDIYRYLMLTVMPARKMQALSANPPPKGTSIWVIFEEAYLAGFEFSRREPQLTRLGLRLLKDVDQSPDIAQIAAAQRKLGHSWVAQLLAQGQRQGEVAASLEIPLATPFVAHALGEGSMEQMAALLDTSKEELFAQPDLAHKVSSAQARALIRSIIDMLRSGIGGSNS